MQHPNVPPLWPQFTNIPSAMFQPSSTVPVFVHVEGYPSNTGKLALLHMFPTDTNTLQTPNHLLPTVSMREATFNSVMLNLAIQNMLQNVTAFSNFNAQLSPFQYGNQTTTSETNTNSGPRPNVPHEVLQPPIDPSVRISQQHVSANARPYQNQKMVISPLSYQNDSTHQVPDPGEIKVDCIGDFFEQWINFLIESENQAKKLPSTSEAVHDVPLITQNENLHDRFSAGSEEQEIAGSPEKLLAFIQNLPPPLQTVFESLQNQNKSEDLTDNLSNQCSMEQGNMDRGNNRSGTISNRRRRRKMLKPRKAYVEKVSIPQKDPKVERILRLQTEDKHVAKYRIERKLAFSKNSENQHKYSWKCAVIQIEKSTFEFGNQIMICEQGTPRTMVSNADFQNKQRSKPPAPEFLKYYFDNYVVHREMQSFPQNRMEKIEPHELIKSSPLLKSPNFINVFNYQKIASIPNLFQISCCVELNVRDIVNVIEFHLEKISGYNRRAHELRIRLLTTDYGYWHRKLHTNAQFTEKLISDDCPILREEVPIVDIAEFLNQPNARIVLCFEILDASSDKKNRNIEVDEVLLLH